MPADKVTLKIPRPMYEHLKQTIVGSGFGSVNEFVVYILRELTSSGPAKEATPAKGAPASKQQTDASGLTREEVEIIKQRLRNLGYL
jgi:Arc/MetJ-type ribon-helix-helix transcriptional regulator